ncbi:DeoR/GlpR family DNA-binding transcription regulator [Rhizobium deserti]|nr:DeoR/GlpR family DNA-binding transcription regulator [Rhizobium deserti]
MDHFVGERQTQILLELRAKGRVSAQDLAQTFDVSEDTVRRDLREMAARGECERVYGGALLPRGQTVPLNTRMTELPDRKAVLGRTAGELLVDGSVVFFDAGSTNLAIARNLPEGLRLTAVTNTPVIAAELAGRSGVELIVIGGRIDPSVGAAIDSTAIKQLESMRPDLCILGACGLTLEEGLAADVFEDAAFKRLACAASRRCLAAVTTDKMGHRAAFHVHDLTKSLSLVLEADADEALVDRIVGKGVNARRADAFATLNEKTSR